MTWFGAATVGCCAVGVGVFVAVLVANLEPQPEYPALMTDLLRLIGLAVAVCAIGIGLVFLVAAGQTYSW